MATTINDAFTAIDDYMAKNGKGQNYLAKKFVDLFEGADSPLNVKNGAMVAVVDKFKKLGKSIDNFDITVNSMGMKVRILMAALKPTSFRLLNDSADRLSKKFDSYGKALKLPRLSSSVARINNPFPKKIENHLSNIDKNISRIEHTTGFTKFIISTMATMMAASSREKVLPSSSTGSYSSRSLQLFSNNSYTKSSGDDKKGGWLSSIISNVLLGAAAFLGIGVIGKFMSNSPTGRVITSAIKSAFTFVGDSMSSFIKTGKFSKMIKESFSSIRDIFTTVVGGISDYIKNNQNDIKKAFFDIGDAFSSEIWKPLKEGAKKAWNEEDYTTLITGGLGVVGIYKLITKLPLFKQVDKYLLRPIFSAAIKMPIMNIINSISSTVLPGITSIMTKLGMVGIIAGEIYVIMKGLQSMYNSIKNIKKRTSEVNEQSEFSKNSAKGIAADFIREYGVRLNELMKKNELGTISLREEKELRYLNLMKDNSDIQLKYTELVSQEKWSRSKSLSVYKEYEKRLDDNVDAIIKLENTLKTSGKNDNLTRGQIINKDVDEMVARIRPTKVQDAEIIIPDKKDSHLFAKGGGPFDVALKDVNKKVDMIISVLSDGFSGLAQITAQSGGVVAQAVVASAGASKQSPVTVIGGSNAIQRHRINTGRHIEFRQ